VTRNATPEKRQPTLEPLDEEVDHAAARPGVQQQGGDGLGVDG